MLSKKQLEDAATCEVRSCLDCRAYNIWEAFDGKESMLNKLRDEIHQNAVDHGWWEEDRGFGEIIALCHSELSEALEEYRNSNSRIRGLPVYYSGGGYIATSPTAICKKPEGIAVELADCIIRILDYCGRHNIDIDGIIRLKHEYNKSRPYKHGGKKI